MPFYVTNPKFRSLDFFKLADEQLISFIRKEDFNVNKQWSRDNPVLHLLLANEQFDDFNRCIGLMPQHINPNLCDGPSFGSKSLLIMLVLLVSSGSLPLKFINLYKEKLNLNYQDATGRTALHYAVILGRHDIVNALMTLGASAVIQDKYNKKAFDYLFCDAKDIRSVLKQIDIEPLRDVNATLNTLRDHLERPLILQGVQLTQQKSIVQRVLHAAKKGECQLILYIGGSSNWGTFVGDQTEATRSDMINFAQEIAHDFSKPLEEVLLNQTLSPQEQNEFCEYLTGLEKQLAGISVLSNCLGGHHLIAKLYSATPAHEATSSTSLSI